MIIQLPLTSDPSQNVTVQLGSVTYDLNVYWNDRAACWYLDVTDHVSQVPLVSALALVLGGNIVGAYPELGLATLLVVDEDNTGVDAGPEDLGIRVNVYWYSDGVSS